MEVPQPILDVRKGHLNSYKITLLDLKVKTLIVDLEAAEASPECNNFMEVTFTTLADFSTKIILLVVKAKISMVTDVKNAKQKWKKSKPT